MQVGTWNVGGMSGMGGEVCGELRKRMVDVCCLPKKESTGLLVVGDGVKEIRVVVL